jgi:uncharacterized protein (DUF849 family)
VAGETVLQDGDDTATGPGERRATMTPRKLIIQVRLNEGMPKQGNPNTPYSPEEIANAAIECHRAGAAVVHYHARDPHSGAASSSVELYAEVVHAYAGSATSSSCRP